MASNYWGKNAKKAAKKSVRKAHKGIIATALISLLIGFAAGYLGASYLSINDHFSVIGEKEIILQQGESYIYQEKGAELISLGRNISSEVVILHELIPDEYGNYPIDTSAERTYVITYTTDDIKYGNIKRIRTITVVGGN